MLLMIPANAPGKLPQLKVSVGPVLVQGVCLVIKIGPLFKKVGYLLLFPLVLCAGCQGGGGGGRGAAGPSLGSGGLWQLLPSPHPLSSHWPHSPGLEAGWIASLEMSSWGLPLSANLGSGRLHPPFPCSTSWLDFGDVENVTNCDKSEKKEVQSCIKSRPVVPQAPLTTFMGESAGIYILLPGRPQATACPPTNPFIHAMSCRHRPKEADYLPDPIRASGGA